MRDKLPAELSGGMTKRVALARASRSIPRSSSSTSPPPASIRSPRGDFDELIRTLQQTLGLTVFMVTHDLESLYSVCDRVAALADGKVVEGPIASMLLSDHPWVRSVFGGERGKGLAQVTQAHAEIRG